MRLFPAYTVDKVLNLYAITFYTLLREGGRSMYAGKHIDAHIALLPNMTDEARQNYLQTLEWASKPPSAILNSSEGDSTPEELKKMFKG